MTLLTIVEQSQRLLTLETCYQSDEETWPDKQKDNDNDKDKDKYKDKDNDKDKYRRSSKNNVVNVYRLSCSLAYDTHNDNDNVL